MKPYMPSNGSEGMQWTEEWCDQCSRRALDPGAKTQCVHELKALAGIDNKKWYYVDDKPTCLAFRDKKDKKRTIKSREDKNQRKLF